MLAGYLSPVHSGYGKPGLISAEDRVQLCQAATATSDWVMTDAWEAQQPAHTKTLFVLLSVQERLAAALEEDPVRLATVQVPATRSSSGAHVTKLVAMMHHRVANHAIPVLPSAHARLTPAPRDTHMCACSTATLTTKG